MNMSVKKAFLYPLEIDRRRDRIYFLKDQIVQCVRSQSITHWGRWTPQAQNFSFSYHSSLSLN